jgi:hypothetical protein
VNFNSDPDKATVIRADSGKELGLTPLSIEVPYSDAAVEFVFKKPGFENKVMYIVPNLPSPLFATLQATPKPTRPEGPTAVKSASGSPATSKSTRRRPGSSRSDKIDDDAVLEPTY